MPLFYTGDTFELNDQFVVLPANAAAWFQEQLNYAIYLATQPANWQQDGLIDILSATYAATAAYYEMYIMPDPTGSIVAYALLPADLPIGCLYCDGASYATIDYPILFGKIGYLFGGTGDHFNVPDIRSRDIIGSGAGPGLTTRTLAATLGEETHTLITAEIPSHSHTNTPHGHSVSAAAPNLTTIGPGVPEPTAVPLPSVTGFASVAIDNTGGDGSHNNMQPSIVMTYAIVTGQ